MLRYLCFSLTFICPIFAQPYRTYVGEIGTDFVLLAWGTTGGANTIGRSSPPIGTVEIQVGDHRATVSDQNWTYVRGLEPDREYSYQVTLKGSRIGQGSVRTWPVKATQLVFFAMGDWGDASREQYRLADVMTREFERRRGTPNPVRFVLSLGDTIYADHTLRGLARGGASDRDWDNKFFQPYESVIRSVPFYAVLGNHDGNESENRGDLPQFLDNLFFPGAAGKPARWFQFNFGGLADFFGLDSTQNSEIGSVAPQYRADGPQSRWLAEALPAARAPWKILFYHHPPFNAGPRHPSYLPQLRHWVDLASRLGVSAVFTGHEHNFQFTEQSEKTGHVRYVISGSGGELRTGKVQRYMRSANISGWARQNQFALVEIAGDTMHVTPIGFEPIRVSDPDGRLIEMPLEIKLRGGTPATPSATSGRPLAP